jgi:hypothetical protein
LKNGQDIKERAENGKHGLIASAFSTPYWFGVKVTSTFPTWCKPNAF